MRNSGGNPAGGVKWNQIAFWGGGWTTAGPCFANDGYAVCGVDVFGAYLRGPSDTRWSHLYTSDRLPAGEFGASQPSYPNMNAPGGDGGCYAIGIAPSDSTRIYMTRNFTLFKSSDRGASFTKLGGPYEFASNNDFRHSNDRIAIDPQKPNAFMLGAMCGIASVTGSVSGTTLTVSAVSSGTSIAVGSRILTTGRSDIAEEAYYVTALGTGTGGTGTYTLNSSPGTIASESMSLSVPAKVLWSTDGSTINTIQTTGGWQRGISDGPSGVLVACDPTSAVVGGVKQGWAYAVYGEGIYTTTGGPGGTFALVSGSPKNAIFLRYDGLGNLWCLQDGAFIQGSISGTTLTVTNTIHGAVSIGQVVQGASGTTKVTAFGTGIGHNGTYTVDTSQTLGSGFYVLDPGAIFKMAHGGSSFSAIAHPFINEVIHEMAISSDGQKIVLCTEDGWLQLSLDGAGTWVGNNTWQNGQNTSRLLPYDVAWVSGGKPSVTGFTKGRMDFNPIDGSLWRGEGGGVYRCTALPSSVSTTSPWTWNAHYTGISSIQGYGITCPPNGPAVLACSDFGFVPITDKTGSRLVNHIPNGAGDTTAWHAEYAPGTPTFIAGACSFWATSQVDGHGKSLDGGLTWSKFPSASGVSQYPGGANALGGGIIPVSTTELYWFPSNNFNPAVSTNGGSSFALEDWSSSLGVTVGAFGTLGAGSSALNTVSKAMWDGSGNQAYAVTVNAPSGAGSVVDNAGALAVAVTPPSGTTTATAVAAYITANSTLIKATAGGTGASAAATGAVTLSFISGWGYSLWNVHHTAIQSDKTTGDLYGYNYGQDGQITSAFFFKKPFGSSPVKLTGTLPSFAAATGMLRLVPGHSGDLLWRGETDGNLYRATVSGTTANFAAIPNVSGCLCFDVGVAAPLKSYPSVVFYGSWSGTGPSFWRTDDNFSTAVNLGAYPGNVISTPAEIGCSKDTHGEFYALMNGSNIWRGSYDCAFTLQ